MGPWQAELADAILVYPGGHNLIMLYVVYLTTH